MAEKLERPKDLDRDAEPIESPGSQVATELEVVRWLRHENARWAVQVEAEKAELEARKEFKQHLISGYIIEKAQLNQLHVDSAHYNSRISDFETRIANAMKHHTRKRPVGFYEDWCDECDVVWPCPTVFALEGEE